MAHVFIFLSNGLDYPGKCSALAAGEYYLCGGLIVTSTMVDLARTLVPASGWPILPRGDEKMARPLMYDGAGQLVGAENAADAVKWFAKLWASGLFDCGPQNNEFMVNESIQALEAALKKRLG
jgi:hypothetical protein